MFTTKRKSLSSPAEDTQQDPKKGKQEEEKAEDAKVQRIASLTRTTTHSTRTLHSSQPIITGIEGGGTPGLYDGANRLLLAVTNGGLSQAGEVFGTQVTICVKASDANKLEVSWLHVTDTEDKCCALKSSCREHEIAQRKKDVEALGAQIDACLGKVKQRVLQGNSDTADLLQEINQMVALQGNHEAELQSLTSAFVPCLVQYENCDRVAESINLYSWLGHQHRLITVAGGHK